MRLATTVAFAAAAAFALAFASPARACDCAQHEQTAGAHKRADDKAAAQAAGTKAGAQVVRDEKVDASTAGSTLQDTGCNCDKEGKHCTCPKGQCKCPNCKDHKAKGPEA